MPLTPDEIQALRKQLGEGVADFGRRFHRSGRTVEDWEQGRRTPDPMVQDALGALAKRLASSRKPKGRKRVG